MYTVQTYNISHSSTYPFVYIAKWVKMAIIIVNVTSTVIIYYYYYYYCLHVAVLKLFVLHRLYM